GLFARGGILAIRECFVNSNRSAGGGGGVLSGRGGQAGGGGIYVLDGTVTIGESTFASNMTFAGPTSNSRYVEHAGSDGHGGGFLLLGGIAMIMNCTFSRNLVTGGTVQGWLSASQAGGTALGGGLLVASNLATVVNCTFFGNRVIGGTSLAPVPMLPNGPNGDAHGGGFVSQSGTLSLLNTIIDGNTATTNSTPSDGYGTVVSQGHNLIGSAAEVSGLVASDLQNVSANLGPLEDNGGFAPTHALSMNSPALDVGDSAGAPPIDQGGVTRPQGTGVDLG